MSSSQITPVPMPELGNSMEEGTVLAWHVAVGEQVEIGQVLCEIETDKATVEFEAPAAGRVARILCGEGETLPVREPILLLGESEEAVQAFLNQAPTSQEPEISLTTSLTR